MEYLLIVLVVILSCLVYQISCAVLSQVDTGVKMTLEVDRQDVLQQQVDGMIDGTLVQQVQEQQMANNDEINGINNSQKKLDKIIGNELNSDNIVNRRTDDNSADKQRNLLQAVKKILHNSQSRRTDNRLMGHLIVNTAALENAVPTHRDNNHFREETLPETDTDNDVYEILPSTNKMSYHTTVEELDGVIIGCIVGGFLAIWAVVVMTIICCSFCNYHPLHRERLSDVYREYGMEDNWYTMSDYSDYKREYQRI